MFFAVAATAFVFRVCC